MPLLHFILCCCFFETVSLKSALIFYQLLPQCYRWHLIVVVIFGRLVLVVDVSALAPHRQSCRRRRLVGVAVLSLLAVASVLGDASAVCYASLSVSSSFGLLSLTASRCCLCRIPVAGVVVVGCLVFGCISLLLLLSACRCWRRWRRLIVVVGSGVAAFS